MHTGSIHSRAVSTGARRGCRQGSPSHPDSGMTPNPAYTSDTHHTDASPSSRAGELVCREHVFSEYVLALTRETGALFSRQPATVQGIHLTGFKASS